MNTVLAAPGTGASFTQGLGAVGLSSLAAAGFIVLIIAIRNKSEYTRKFFSDLRHRCARCRDRRPVHDRRGTWRNLAEGVHSTAASALTAPDLVAGVTPAGLALIFFVMSFLPEWEKRLPLRSSG